MRAEHYARATIQSLHVWKRSWSKCSRRSNFRTRNRCFRRSILNPTMNRHTSRVHQLSCDENGEVSLQMKFNTGAEQTSHYRKISQVRNLVLDILNVFPNQSTKSNRLPIPDRHLSGNFPSVEEQAFRFCFR